MCVMRQIEMSHCSYIFFNAIQLILNLDFHQDFLIFFYFLNFFYYSLLLLFLFFFRWETEKLICHFFLKVDKTKNKLREIY